jgi:uncharacterized iron-regulated membrane protein
VTRSAWVFFHRWAGLSMAGFLLVAGLTGALLAWYEELDAALNPQLFKVIPSAPGAPLLDAITLRDMTARQTGETIRYFSLRMPAPGHSVMFRPDNGRDEQIFVDPYTGRILGRRIWGDISQGTKNLMPFVYRLHQSLALEQAGIVLMGIVALVWTLDCFVGAYLTFPAPPRKGRPLTSALSPQAGRGGKTWLVRWWPSWKLRLGSGGYKLNFDLHRAGGLWVWAMLFVLAWSSVAFNLSAVYDPVMRTLFAHQPEAVRGALPVPNDHPALDWRQARETAKKLMAEQAQRHGFTVLAEDWFVHDPVHGLYFYDVRSSLDVSDRKGKTRLFIDADSGALIHLQRPTGAAAGDTMRTWITGLHRAELWGLPFKLFMTAMGSMVAMLSVTGGVIWWKKRKARRHGSLRGFRVAQRAGY